MHSASIWPIRPNASKQQTVKSGKIASLPPYPRIHVQTAMASNILYRIEEKETVQSLSQTTPIRIRNQSVTLIIALITAILMSFTIFFAYNSSLQNPMLSLFVSKRPERSILILNAASHLTLYALAELTSSVFDAIRWALACHGSGTTALTFITLSRATSFIGSIYLSMGRSDVLGKSPRNGHRVWGGQRYIV
jgi:hypothetical protein